jgi:hypothetical protein
MAKRNQFTRESRLPSRLLTIDHPISYDRQLPEESPPLPDLQHLQEHENCERKSDTCFIGRDPGDAKDQNGGRQR